MGISFTISNKISDNLYLVRKTIGSANVVKQVDLPINHIAVIDCSGSMSNDLPKIREQLKKKLPKLIKETDTFSLIWFSGRNEFGCLLESEPIASLKDLKNVNDAIDRWLKPVGMTSFKEPLEEVERLVSKVGSKNKNVFSLFFIGLRAENPAL